MRRNGPTCSFPALAAISPSPSPPPPLTPVPPTLLSSSTILSVCALRSASNSRRTSATSLSVRCCNAIIRMFAARSSSAFSAFFASFSALFCCSQYTKPPATPNTNASPRNSAAALRAWSSVITAIFGLAWSRILRPPELTKGSASGGAMTDWYTASARMATRMHRLRSVGLDLAVSLSCFARGLDTVFRTRLKALTYIAMAPAFRWAGRRAPREFPRGCRLGPPTRARARRASATDGARASRAR